MDTKQLTYFIEMSDRLSFRDTAEALYISQSALSRQISELEKELGAKLFKRSTRRVELTEEGRLCLKSAQRILDEAGEMKRRVTNSLENPSGRLTVGCYENGRHTLFYELLYRFQSRYRMIKADLIMGDIPDIKHRFERNELDAVIALRASFADGEGLEYTVIEPGQLYAVLPAGHRLAGLESVSPEELRNDRVFIRNAFTRQILDSVIKRAGLTDVVVGSSKNASLSNIVRVALGEGVILAPAFGLELAAVAASDTAVTVCMPVAEQDNGMFDEVLIRKKSNSNSACRYFENIVNEYKSNDAPGCPEAESSAEPTTKYGVES